MGTYIISVILEKKYEESITTKKFFKGVRLKDLIESSKNATVKLAFVQRQLADLKKSLKRESKILKDESKKLIQEIDQREIEQQEKDELKLKEENDLKARLTDIEEEYKEKIGKTSKEIENLKKQIQRQKKQVEEEISAAERIAQNARRLQKIKIDELINRYDPVIRENNILKILRDKNKYRLKDFPTLSAYKPNLEKEIQVSPKDFEKRIEQAKELNILTGRMHKLPYKKSVPKMVKRIDSLNKEMIAAYESLWMSLYQSIQRKNQLLKNYRQAFRSLLASERENGYILNVVDSSNVYVYVNDIFKIEKGSQAMVFRKDDEFIGKISIISFSASEDVKAKVIELSENEQIKPFDKILITTAVNNKEKELQQ